ncbi:AP-3 complex subunit sigma-1 isoform X1 [Rhizophagus irregularis DAOM 181602=DAOM 197198]|nr:AP-3 complex subunit sigma-1 isoform X1 [Rhizophagus irregularis DAOM 181602=DAOM 197198]
MIKSVLIFNNHGKPRITKFYQQIDIGTQQALIQEIFSLVSKRPDTVCNFLEGSQMLGGILDLIQVFVESLDKCFENVCELDLIFHFEEVHHILAEVISGGMVLETNITEIVHSFSESNKFKKRSGAMATIAGSGAGAVARDLGANLANTVTTTLQSTLQNTMGCNLMSPFFFDCKKFR